MHVIIQHARPVDFVPKDSTTRKRIQQTRITYIKPFQAAEQVNDYECGTLPGTVKGGLQLYAIIKEAMKRGIQHFEMDVEPRQGYDGSTYVWALSVRPITTQNGASSSLPQQAVPARS